MNTALTGLAANQQALRTTANNIANVNTPGYTRQVVQFDTRVSEGVVTGVEIGDIKRIVDIFLEDASRIAIADAEQFTIATEMHSRLQSLLGSPDQNTSLSGRLDELFTGLSNLVLDPASPARRQTALSSLEDFATEVVRLAEQLQLLRADASARITNDIANLNNLLKSVADLNPIIVREMALGGNTGGLEEQRDKALREIAEIIDIRVNRNSDGSIRINTSNGVTLLDNTLYELHYTAPGTVLAETNFGQITIHKIDPVTGAVDAFGQPLDPVIQSGSLRGLLDMRDETLPDIATALGELSARVIDQLNAVHNANTAVPAPNVLTGRNVGILTTDKHGFTGDATFVVLAADGSVVNSVAIDFDALGAAATVNDLITAVNAGLGADGTLALAGGVMTLTATNPANGIAIVQDATDPSSRAGRGFAYFFGLNDLMSAQVPTHFDTGFSTTDDHGFTPGGTINLELRGPSGVIEGSYTLTIAGATFDDLLNDLNQPANLGALATFSLDASGALVITPKTGFENIEIAVVSDSTSRGATGISLSNLFGMGASFRMNAAKGVKLTDPVAQNIDRLSLARVDLGVAPGTPAINVGDAKGAMAFEDLISTTIAFARAGQLSAVSTTLGRYSANFLSNTALLAERADNLNNSSGALRRELETRIANISGVNMDEELANMVIFQNAFNAAARLITTAQAMFDALLDATR